MTRPERPAGAAAGGPAGRAGNERPGDHDVQGGHGRKRAAGSDDHAARFRVPHDREVTTFCRICESLCGLRVAVDGNRVVGIRPDAEHVATGGFACPKGLFQHELYDSPDRLQRPMRRVAPGVHEPVDWDRALREIGGEVARIRAAHGPDAIAMYVGTAAGFGVLHPVFAQGFMDAVGSRNMFASATQDCANKFAVAEGMYGFPFTQPFPDLLHTGCLIIVGANPLVSKWSFLQVPDPRRHLQGIQARGGQVWVVDPRRTETARAADRYVAIRPNTDVFFYLAFLAELIATGGVDEPRIAATMDHWDEVRALALPWTPERSAEVTGIAPELLREMVACYRTAPGAALYSSTGVNMGRHGALAFWLQECINAASGNLDRTGGTLVGDGIIDFAKFGKRHGLLVKDDRSRIGGFRKTNDAFPGGILADEILTPGPGQVRALFVTGGNPLLTMADAGRLREAFGQLELLVVLDILPTETATAAHWMLPCTSPLERPDLPFIFPLMLGLQVRPYLQATEAVVEPAGEQRDEATIYIDLCAAAGLPLFGSRVAQWALRGLRAVHSALARRGRQPALPQRLLLDLLLRVCGQPGLRRLLGHPHGLRRPDHRPGSFVPARVYTANGRIDLFPERLRAAAGELAARFEQERARQHTERAAGGLRLITRRAVLTHNSWTHNHADFLRRGGTTNHVYMHPDDAAARGLAEGALADVTSAAATIRLPVALLADLSPGVVAVPHGWGHQRSGNAIARSTTGVNVNLLASSGPDAVDPLSGMSHLTGIPVEVRPAAGGLDRSDWSGVAPAAATGGSTGVGA